MSSWSREQRERIWRWWCAARPERFTICDAAQVLGIDEPSHGQCISIGRALSQLGFLKQAVLVEGTQRWVYRPSVDIAARTE